MHKRSEHFYTFAVFSPECLSELRSLGVCRCECVGKHPLESCILYVDSIWFLLFQLLQFGDYACCNNIHWVWPASCNKNFKMHFWLYQICHCHKLIAVGCVVYARTKNSHSVSVMSLVPVLFVCVCESACKSSVQRGHTIEIASLLTYVTFATANGRKFFSLSQNFSARSFGDVCANTWF